MPTDEQQDRFFEHLLEEHGTFRSLVESSPDFVAIVDRHHRHRYISHVFPGFSVDEVLGTTVYEYLEPEYHAPTRASIDSVLDTGRLAELTTRGKGPDGGVLWYKTVFSPLRDGDEIIGVVLRASDVTAETNSARELAHERMLFRQALEVAEGVIVVLDVAGRVTLINRAGAAILGVDAGEVVRQPWFDRFLPEEERVETFTEFRNVLAGEQRTARFRNEVVTASGERRVIDWHNTLIRDEYGEVSGTVSFGEDITDLGDTQRALLEREAQLASVFRAAPIGIGMVIDRVFMRVNRRFCEMLGYAEDELVGHGARMVYPSQEEFERVGQVKYAQINERGSGGVATKMVRKDGTVIDVLLSSAPLDPDDLSAGVTFTVLELGDRTLAQP